MSDLATIESAPPQLAHNILHFARVLRAAGLPVGTDRVLLSLQALQITGLAQRRDFHAVLSACLLDRIEHRELFDQAFALFWREPALDDPLRAWLGSQHSDHAEQPALQANQRLGQAFANQLPAPQRPDSDLLRSDAQAEDSHADERLRRIDFNAMSADEWRQAQRLLAGLRPLFEPLPTRRTRPATRPGRPDWRATLQAMARHGGQLWDLRWRQVHQRPAPLVVLADISGSMQRYSRMLLHFAHALSNGRKDARGAATASVESFVFGTRLTRITRLLAGRDPDIAIAQVVHAVQDWSGGTRITDSLHEFNQKWARRVLPSQATVLLMTDGLEHGDARALAFEMERLHKSCRRLLWLNPLLRFEQFAPRAGGIQAMLPHTDAFLPAHNLRSLSDLMSVLARAATRRTSPTR